jgi:hypothetical protein
MAGEKYHYAVGIFDDEFNIIKNHANKNECDDGLKKAEEEETRREEEEAAYYASLSAQYP